MGRELGKKQLMKRNKKPEGKHPNSERKKEPAKKNQFPMCLIN